MCTNEIEKLPVSVCCSMSSSAKPTRAKKRKTASEPPAAPPNPKQDDDKDKKEQSVPSWDEVYDRLKQKADEFAKCYRTQLGQWVIEGKEVDQFPADEVADELFDSFVPFTVFNPAEVKKFTRAIHEYQMISDLMRDRKIKLPEDSENIVNDSNLDSLSEALESWMKAIEFKRERNKRTAAEAAAGGGGGGGGGQDVAAAASASPEL